MSDLPPPPLDIERETRSWALILHLSQFAGYLVPLAGFVAPIVIWQIKRDQLPALDAHGRNATNWLISYVIYMAISIPLCFVLIGIPLVAVLFVAGLVFPIIAGVKGSNGEVWSYPGAIPFIGATADRS